MLNSNLLLQALNTLHTDYVTAAKTAAEEAAGAVAAAYSTLADSMTREQQQLSSFTQQQSAAVDAVYGATQSIVSAMREQLQAAQAQVNVTTRAVWLAGWGLSNSDVCCFDEEV